MNKASGVDEIAAELFQILKDDTAKMLYSICQQIWKIQQWLQDWERSVFIPIITILNNVAMDMLCVWFLHLYKNLRGIND